VCPALAEQVLTQVLARGVCTLARADPELVPQNLPAQELALAPRVRRPRRARARPRSSAAVVYLVVIALAARRLIMFGQRTSDDKVREIRRRFDWLNTRSGSLAGEYATAEQTISLLRENGDLQHTDGQRQLADDLFDHLMMVREMEASQQ
jgi:hypothetical protein